MHKIIVKMILLVCALIFFSNSSFAISLSELQTVSQFVNVGSKNDGDAYLNVNSIQSIRYNPPYYSLKYMTYYVNYNQGYILETEEISNYDYNYSYEMLIKNNKFSSIKTIDAFKAEVIRLKYQNSGIEGGHRIKKVYNLDGILIEDLSSNSYGYESKQIKFLTIGYDLATEAFYKAYRLRF